MSSKNNQFNKENYIIRILWKIKIIVRVRKVAEYKIRRHYNLDLYLLPNIVIFKIAI